MTTCIRKQNSYCLYQYQMIDKKVLQNIFTQKKKTLHRYRYLYTLQKDKSELCLTYQFDKVLDFAF